jgi:WD40 repeat protein
MITFRHESQITSLALSPDNQILAVGGQNSDIYIWSLKNQKLIRSFGSNTLEKGQDELMVNQEKEPIEIIDINWSNDGTMLAAGFEKSLVLLDMRKILSTPVEHLLM